MGAHCHQAASLFKAGMVLCRPSTSAMLRALELLLALGALGAEGALTPLGRHMVPPPCRARLRQGEAAPCWALFMRTDPSQPCPAQLFSAVGVGTLR